MPAAERRKGVAFEREVARALRSVFERAERGFQFRDGSDAAPDVDGTPWWIECKNRKTVKLKEWWETAVVQNDGRDPLLVIKRAGFPLEKCLVVMHFETFLSIVENINGGPGQAVRGGGEAEEEARPQEEEKESRRGPEAADEEEGFPDPGDFWTL